MLGGGYAGMAAVSFDETMRMLMGTAIRYTDATGPGNPTKPGEASLQERTGEALHETAGSHSQ